MGEQKRFKTNLEVTPRGTKSLSSIKNPPNLLIIKTDQQSCWSLNAYGGNLISTPHIDSLAKEGAIFNNFFTNSALCTPSRACFLTGRYPHVHGAYANNIQLNRDEITLAHILRDNGYDTGYSGKWHLDGKLKTVWLNPERSMGFTDCRYMFNWGHWKKITDKPERNIFRKFVQNLRFRKYWEEFNLIDPREEVPKVYPYKVIGDENTYTTDWLTKKTIDFISRPRKNPFFYMLSIPDPHPPYCVRAPYDGMFKPKEMPLPGTLRQSNVPTWAKESVSDWAKDERSYSLSELKLRAYKADYCGAVKLIDDSLGRILNCLRKQGILDHTIIVFTTDHGEYMGEHGLLGKNALYETAYRIPMLIRWPEGISEGTIIDKIVTTVDFQQTILNLMGLKPSGREQGQDVSPLLKGENMDCLDVAYIHHSSLTRAGIFTPLYELAYVKDSEHILFDRKNDPSQERNLFYNPKYTGVIEELTDRLIEHNVEVGAPAAEWLKKLYNSIKTHTYNQKERDIFSSHIPHDT